MTNKQFVTRSLFALLIIGCLGSAAIGSYLGINESTDQGVPGGATIVCNTITKVPTPEWKANGDRYIEVNDGHRVDIPNNWLFVPLKVGEKYAFFYRHGVISAIEKTADCR